MGLLRKLVRCACFAIIVWLPAGNAYAEPQNGWWWNPNESGRGYFIEMTGGVMYLAGYFYDVSGRATWLSSGGPVTDLYSYSGTLQSYRDGQSVFGAYRAPATAVDVGAVTVTFSDDSHGTLTWPGGTVQIERQIFGIVDPAQVFDPRAPDGPPRPKTGWWWDPAESGSGYSVEIQGDQAFVVAFMYDESGNPIWYFTAGPMSSPTHFEADWLEFSEGQTLSGPYRPPATPRNLGRVTIDFVAFDDATITFTERAAPKRRGKHAAVGKLTSAPRSRRSRTGPQFPAPTWNDAQFWPYYYCAITQAFHTETRDSGGFILRDTVFYYSVGFRHNPNSGPIAGTGAYVVDLQRSSWSFSLSVVDSESGCTTNARKDNITPLDGYLRISPYLFFYGQVLDRIGTDVTSITESCRDDPSPHRDVATVYPYAPIGNWQSMVQRPNPYPTLPSPYFRTRDRHTEPDGSFFDVEVNCVASLSPLSGP